VTIKTLPGGFQFDDSVLPSSSAAGSNSGPVLLHNDLLLGGSGVDTARVRSLQATAPTIGSGGTGVSALSVVAGSTNEAGACLATLTAVAPGVVVGVVSFHGAPLKTAPIAVSVHIKGPTAGVAAPPILGSDTFSTSGFTIRSIGPTTVTTAAYIIGYVCVFA
jgi:hypothetical protein